MKDLNYLAKVLRKEYVESSTEIRAALPMYLEI